MAITNKAKKSKATRINKIIKKWTAMLTSGDYKKTTGALHRVKKNGTHSYCCLGVLCELAVKEGVIPKKSVSKKYEWDNEIFYLDEASELPEKVQKWAGLASSLGDFQSRNYKETSLASLNDAGKSFSEIAKLIESRPKGLFVNW